MGRAIASLLRPLVILPFQLLSDTSSILSWCRAALKLDLPHFRCNLETVAQRQPVEHAGVAPINARTAEPEKRDRPNGL
jgi:hypothetical protein